MFRVHQGSFVSALQYQEIDFIISFCEMKLSEIIGLLWILREITVKAEL